MVYSSLLGLDSYKDTFSKDPEAPVRFGNPQNAQLDSNLSANNTVNIFDYSFFKKRAVLTAQSTE
jgi:hypothetical protein